MATVRCTYRSTSMSTRLVLLAVKWRAMASILKSGPLGVQGSVKQVCVRLGQETLVHCIAAADVAKLCLCL